MADNGELTFPSTTEYLSGREESHRLWKKASAVFPQGISGQAKWFAPFPIYSAHAEGAYLQDVDGNRYVDLLMGAGPMLLGHSHPRVVDAVREQVGVLHNPMMPHARSAELAERIRGHMPYLERLRFANTGSESTRSAVRVARAARGRHRIAKFEGNYHGSDDAFLVSTHSREVAGSALRPEGVLDYGGLAPELARDTLILPYNQPEAAAQLIEENAGDLAAVIMEPVAFSSGGGVPATREFAAAVRDATAKHGVILIYDEVLCAYRLGLAGAPAYLGVTPDLATIGKAVGGGMPLAAFGGRADLMDATLGPDAGAQKIFHSGTFTENPVAIAAGHAALDVLESEPILERADSAAEAMRVGLSEAFEEVGIDAAITGMGSIFQVHVGVSEVNDRRGVLRANHEATRTFLLGMVANGVLWPPVHPAVTSGAHTDEEVELVLNAARKVLATATTATSTRLEEEAAV